jgi:hypothetical protein
LKSSAFLLTYRIGIVLCERDTGPGREEFELEWILWIFKNTF